MRAGDRVVVKGLIAQTELNGRMGTLLQYVTKKARWALQVDDEPKGVLVSESNLLLAEPAVLPDSKPAKSVSQQSFAVQHSCAAPIQVSSEKSAVLCKPDPTSASPTSQMASNDALSVSTPANVETVPAKVDMFSKADPISCLIQWLHLDVCFANA
mmetsp:Transcript_18403/g.47143  ORF Transcript_18403/g.47143 Transcript_18403/m.47143 type:complete len:156 (+) Transcript_18403:18-485(+)|eukprot:CAMPEP_0115841054 /NCGR_PEP_ID=MMETSP0287-20121206/7092_1 /TAXON_ID=412157 /ORGANISM="Chrysochromulina rotalis, Strain UIO044" /LENGTH=155 /DNA_ID=CAMNT_0003294691 /DNA_START=17 /DNA_END=484 /DNA_ORIENTATION=+